MVIIFSYISNILNKVVKQLFTIKEEIKLTLEAPFHVALTAAWQPTAQDKGH